MWQEMLTGAIVLLAVAFTVYRLITRKSCSCGNIRCHEKKSASKKEIPAFGACKCNQGCAGGGKCRSWIAFKN